METKKLDATKEVLFDILEKNNVERFSVDFDGSGDSGQIDSINLDKKILSQKVKGICFREGTFWDNEKNESVKKTRDEATVEEVVEQLCYDYLEDKCGGWEINEGSYGEFIFYVDERKVVLDFNERVMEVNSKTFKF